MDGQSLRNHLKTASETNDFSTWNPSTFTKFIHWISNDKLGSRRMQDALASYQFLKQKNAQLNTEFFMTLLDLIHSMVRKKAEFEFWKSSRFSICQFHEECFPELSKDIHIYIEEYSKDDLNFFSDVSFKI